MALTTRCPQCGTTFKVVPDQLRVRNGLVRCGACSTVFDGRACLLPGADAKALPPVPPAARPATPAPAAAAAAPVLSRPSVEPRQVPPWEDEPASHPHAPAAAPTPAAPRPAPAVPPAPATPAYAPMTPPPGRAEPVIPAAVAPAAAPAVLRGRDAIRRHVEPDDKLPEDEFDDEGPLDRDLEDEMRDDRHGRVQTYRPEPIIATPRGNEPVFNWQDRADEDDRDDHRIDDRDHDRDHDQDHDRDHDHDHDHDRDRDQDRHHDHDDHRIGDHDDPRVDHRNVSRDRPARHHDVRQPYVADHALSRHDAYRADDDGPGFDDGIEPVLGDARTRYSSATDVGRAPPEFLDQDRTERRGLLRKLWGYACLLGLIALGLQLLYVYRTDIANSVPAVRPVLEAACKPLGCTVGYARRLERIAISSSSLQPPTGAAAIDDGRSRLVLNLVLRNRYDKPQHWPALVLDLTDLSDTVVVRRVLRPEDYLTPEQLRGPFAPAGELKISVPIEVTGVQVNGYQLDKFFP